MSLGRSSGADSPHSANLTGGDCVNPTTPENPMTRNCSCRLEKKRLALKPLWVWMSAAAIVAAGLVAANAASFNTTFSTDAGGTQVGVAEIENGVLGQ